MATDPSGAGAVDPYAVPKAKVEDAAPAAEAGTAYFPVSLLKLGVMCVATFSIYEIYWFYKNWKNAQRLAHADVNAPIRAFFYGLTSYWLFRLMRDHAKSVDPGISLPAGALALAVLALALAAAGLNAAGLARAANAEAAASFTIVAGYDASLATHWYDLALELITTAPGFSPPVVARVLGYMGVTLYEALRPGMPGARSLAGQLNGLALPPSAADPPPPVMVSLPPPPVNRLAPASPVNESPKSEPMMFSIPVSLSPRPYPGFRAPEGPTG